MATYETEEIRNTFGRVTAVRVKIYDAQGRVYYVDVNPADAVSIPLSVLLDAVAVQAAVPIAAKTVAPMAQALTTAQVQAIAKTVAVSPTAKKR